MDVEFIDALAPRYQSSKDTKQRRKSKRKLKGGKAGTPSLFQGARALFMRERLQNFIDLKGAARKPQKDFWRALFRDYWETWPWYIPLDKELEDAEWTEPDSTLPENLDTKGSVIKLTQEVRFPR